MRVTERQTSLIPTIFLLLSISRILSLFYCSRGFGQDVARSFLIRFEHQLTSFCFIPRLPLDRTRFTPCLRRFDSLTKIKDRRRECPNVLTGRWSISGVINVRSTCSTRVTHQCVYLRKGFRYVLPNMTSIISLYYLLKREIIEPWILENPT